MSRLIWAALLAFAISRAAGPFIVRWLRRMKLGSNEYELGPSTHKTKQGTPIMGGLIFLLSMAIVPLLLHRPGAGWRYIPAALGGMLGFGAIGFADDFIKLGKKRSLGLTPRQKMIPQIVIAAALSVWAYRSVGSSLIVPFLGTELELGWFYIPIMVFIIVGTVNSANLLDGCDGLLGGCSLIDFLCLACILVLMTGSAEGAEEDGLWNLALVCAASAGALLAFLRFNTHPAQVFMGDSGSFAIGGTIAAVALCTRLSLLLPVICFAMMSSSLSDIIQITYYKATHGKRVFRMAPLQHHFELSGMPETRVVNMYRTGTVLLCLLALLGFLR